MEELREGEVIEARVREVHIEKNSADTDVRHVERDAAKWQILSTDGEEVTFRAGTEVFRVHKSGRIYQEWDKEAKRRADGGALEEPVQGIVIAVTEDKEFHPIGKTVDVNVPPVVRMVDSQLEERQHRLSELRKQYNALDWGVEKDSIREQMVALEKKILGDPI